MPRVRPSCFACVLALASALAPFVAGSASAGVDGAAQPLPETAWVEAIAGNEVASLRKSLPARLERGLPIDARSAAGKTALMAAAAGGDLVLLQQLIAAGADARARNNKGASALMYAAWRGESQIVATLIDAGVPLDWAAGNGWTALTMAAAKGNLAALRQLIRAGARVDPRDVQGWTPLMRASDLGRAAAAAILIESGQAGIDLYNPAGRTPLHLAVAAGHGDIARLLLRAGADPQLADFHGLTPAAMAAHQGIDLTMLRQ